MAADPLDALRLTLMQDLLPVGLAVAERARGVAPARFSPLSMAAAPIPWAACGRKGSPPPASCARVSTGCSPVWAIRW